MTDITAASLGIEVAKALHYGTLCRLKYYEGTLTDANYDSDVVLTSSGTDVWVSGLFQPLDSTRGSVDEELVQQGQLKFNDSKVYFAGSIATSGNVKIGIGSPNNDQYEIIPDGVIGWEMTGGLVYKKVYIRVLPNGSFFGESGT